MKYEIISPFKWKGKIHKPKDGTIELPDGNEDVKILCESGSLVAVDKDPKEDGTPPVKEDDDKKFEEVTGVSDDDEAPVKAGNIQIRKPKT
uniref:Uncharacterized protein n=1 Tax=Candidatus Kentrum sp. UNK TaxID=2126344 RepID=A0A450ZWT0_9GAMM|nr:MAG: hypothetical protein BECKUNK1418G_GA0071005_100242 [Candidatus Kentron sp. UNK]VFK68308.1 MAG: hypothetical protein BECKUNK1418H_GA0071006_100142 [Candidatus Kentron sp. UNK]